MRNRPVSLLASVAVVAALGSCTDDDATMPKAEFIAAADELCLEAEEELDALGEPASLDELVDQLEEGKEVYEQLREDLEALDEPDEDADDAEAVFASLDDVLGGIDDVIAAAESDDPAELDAEIERVDALGDAADDVAADFGFEECGVDDDDAEPVDDTVGDDPDDASVDEQFPVIYEPTEGDVAAVVPLFLEGAEGLFTEEEATCMVQFLLERVRLDEELPELLEREATFRCLSTERLIEIGTEAAEN